MIGIGISPFFKKNPVSTSPYGPLTTAFASSTGITDLTILTALNTAETDLTSNNLINKIYAWWPMVGGTANTHKYNFMDARDLDVAYRLQFNGGFTHSATGVLPNGINSFARTYFTPSIADQNNLTLGYYSRTNAYGTEVEMGSADGSLYCLLEIRTTGITYVLINQTGYTQFADATDSLGMYLGTRVASGDVRGFKNGVQKITGSTASLLGPYKMVYIGAYNNANDSGPSLVSTKECASAIIAAGLTPSEAVALSNIINTLQTTLGRNVY